MGGQPHVWCTSWNISSRGMRVSGPKSLPARRSKAATFCFTTSSKNTVASWECRRERNSKEIWGGDNKGDVQLKTQSHETAATDMRCQRY